CRRTPAPRRGGRSSGPMPRSTRGTSKGPTTAGAGGGASSRTTSWWCRTSRWRSCEMCRRRSTKKTAARSPSPGTGVSTTPGPGRWRSPGTCMGRAAPGASCSPTGSIGRPAPARSPGAATSGWCRNTPSCTPTGWSATRRWVRPDSLVTSTRPSGSSLRTAGAAALCVAAGLGWSLGSRTTAAAPPPPQGAPGPVPRVPLEVTGATRIEYDDATKRWTFSGARVVVVRGTLRVEAPEIGYGERAREVVLPRGGTVWTPTLEVGADRLAALLDTRHVTAEGHVVGRFAGEEPEGQRTRWGTFAADRVEADDRPDL